VGRQTHQVATILARNHLLKRMLHALAIHSPATITDATSTVVEVPSVSMDANRTAIPANQSRIATRRGRARGVRC